MKNRLMVGLGLTLISALGGACAFFNQEASERLMVTLDKPVHFLSLEGTDTALAPGEYTAKRHDEKSIELTATGSGETTVLQAEAGAHEQQLSVPTPVSVASDEDVVHIVLLMPDGTTLDAIGTLSGVRTRGPMFSPLPPQQLAGAMTMQQQRFGRTPVGGGVIPGGPQIDTQLPPQLQTQPGLQKTAPPLTQSGLQLSECVQIVQAGGVRVDVKAEATSSRSITLTWLGFPGRYDVASTGFGTSVQLGTASLKQAPLAQRVPPGGTAATAQPQMFPGTVTHASALPGTRYIYSISGTLADGRRVCGGAEAATPVELTAGTIIPSLATLPLAGWVDLHTHPMSHLAFAGKVFHGAPDIGSLLPAVHVPKQGFDVDPRPVCLTDHRARNMEEALGVDSPTHGGVNQSRCGDENRRFIIGGMVKKLFGQLHEVGNRTGAPNFEHWPTWDDTTHQKMWVEWIRRAHQGGLRVLVALSHNNRTLADVVSGHDPCKHAPLTCVSDDVKSSNLQIEELKAFVRRHSDFMEVALTAADLHRIVSQQKIAVILGVELDNIGNFNLLPAGVLQPVMIWSEIKRLYDTGVRYIFPIHLTDNTFGGTAFYSSDFNWANYRESQYPSHLAATQVPGVGNFWSVGCAFPGEEIGFQVRGGYDAAWGFASSVRHTRLGVRPDHYPPTSPDCTGHRNTKGLTGWGRLAIKEMMRLGMIIDIDHMSHLSVEETLSIAEDIPNGGYPIVSGHNGVRAQNVDHFNTENQRTLAQLARIGCLNGMFGLGTDEGDAVEWAGQYMQAFNAMGAPTGKCPNKSSLGTGRVAFGTDANSLVRTPKPRNVDLYNKPGYPQSGSPKGNGTVWDYNKDGVAHYGMFADFVKDVRTSGNQDLVDNRLMKSAEYFYRMWQKIEAQKSNIPLTCLQKGGPCS